MEIEKQEVVIVGAGVAGLATALGPQRLGISSLVLESSVNLRVTGSALVLWNNAWKAVDALGIGDTLRAKHTNLRGMKIMSTETGLITSDNLFVPQNSRNKYEVRCVNRRFLLETMVNQLPQNTIRYSSKLVHINIDEDFKVIHLADGTCIKSKVLVGSDGVNSVVAQYLGLNKPCFVGSSEIRGLVWFGNGHGFESKFMQFNGNGVRVGVIPSNDHSIYWFFSFNPSPQDDEEMEHDVVKVQQYVLKRIETFPEYVKIIFEKTDPNNISYAPLRNRKPWELLWANMYKDNMCVIGDALHPMTPYIGQGACSALEDGVVLARTLGATMKTMVPRIEISMENFARERRWRSFELISLAYIVGWVQQSDGIVIKFFRDKFVDNWLWSLVFNKTLYDCGKLT